jgi:hypothetical protein
MERLQLDTFSELCASVAGSRHAGHPVDAMQHDIASKKMLYIIDIKY